MIKDLLRYWTRGCPKGTCRKTWESWTPAFSIISAYAGKKNEWLFENEENSLLCRKGFLMSLCVCIRDPFLLGLDAFVECLTEFCIPQELPGARAQLPKVLWFFLAKPKRPWKVKEKIWKKNKNLHKKTKRTWKSNLNIRQPLMWLSTYRVSALHWVSAPFWCLYHTISLSRNGKPCNLEAFQSDRTTGKFNTHNTFDSATTAQNHSNVIWIGRKHGFMWIIVIQPL